MGRGLSQQQSFVLADLKSVGAVGRPQRAWFSPDDKVAAASISRTLARLKRRGLVEKFYHRFASGGLGMNGYNDGRELRWRLKVIG
jgi:hypothetical protein